MNINVHLLSKIKNLIKDGWELEWKQHYIISIQENKSFLIRYNLYDFKYVNEKIVNLEKLSGNIINPIINEECATWKKLGILTKFLDMQKRLDKMEKRLNNLIIF